jgi:hypothetical protein
MWMQLAEYGSAGAFQDKKTFEDLASLMVQIKKREEYNKSKTGLRYTEHLQQFFSLLSENSRTYQLLRDNLAGISLREIR